MYEVLTKNTDPGHGRWAAALRAAAVSGCATHEDVGWRLTWHAQLQKETGHENLEKRRDQPC